MKKRGVRNGRRIGLKPLNSVLASAASLVLTGVPPVVCESVLDEVYCTLRKSIERIKH